MGEIVLFIDTDMEVPKDLTAVRVQLSTPTAVRYDMRHELGPNGFRLPATLGILAGAEDEPVTIRVTAFHDQDAITHREMVTTVPRDRRVMLPVHIQWLCYGTATESAPGQYASTCPAGQSCVAGGCQSNLVDSTTLATFDSASVYGGGTSPATGACFDTVGCFASGYAATLEAPCSIEFPRLGSADQGVNVALVRPPGTQGICGSEACLVPLNAESDSGWKTSGGRIALPAAVCDRLQDGSILGVAVTTACAEKSETEPTCGLWSTVTAVQATTDAGAPSGIVIPSSGGASGSGGGGGQLGGGTSGPAGTAGQIAGQGGGAGAQAGAGGRVGSGGTTIGGSAATGGAVSLAGSGGTGGLSAGAGGSGGTSQGTGGFPPPQACAHTRVTSPDITGITGTWGTAAGIVGGAFLYNDSNAVDAGATPPSRFTADTASSPPNIRLTANPDSGGYSGYGLYFTSCLDATAYDGVSLVVSGNLGGGTLSLQAQTNNDYPINVTSQKGACAGDWASCANNESTIAVTTTPALVEVPWAQFTGGEPSAMEPNELLGLQWQVECNSTTSCAVDLTLGAVRFYTATAGTGGAANTGGMSGAGIAGTGGAGVSGGAPSQGGNPTAGGGSGGVSQLHGCTANIPTATLNSEYTNWRSAYLVDCGDGRARVHNGSPGSVSSDSTSEGIGYGMLLAVGFDDRAAFDQLWSYYTSYRDTNGLMNWSISACTATISGTGSGSDADLDAAMALVQADRRWGGYAADAQALIDAIHAYETLPCGAITVLKPGDAWGDCIGNTLNPSYFAPGYYRAFADYQAADTAKAQFWNTFANDSMTLLLQYQTQVQNALMSEWASATGTVADQTYGVNACRSPWRVVVDYTWWGTADALTFLSKVSGYVDAQGGVAAVPFDKNSAFLGPLALSGVATNKCDSYYTSWMSGVQSDNAYFQSTLRVLSLLVMAGRFAH
jgi:hypothetical protein